MKIVKIVKIAKIRESIASVKIVKIAKIVKIVKIVKIRQNSQNNQDSIMQWNEKQGGDALFLLRCTCLRRIANRAKRALRCVFDRMRRERLMRALDPLCYGVNTFQRYWQSWLS